MVTSPTPISRSLFLTGFILIHELLVIITERNSIIIFSIPFSGTLRPDLIESASSLASSKAHVIKTHHNDTTLVRSMRNKGLVVEPLKDFHKDEVRILGESLGRNG